MKYFVFKYTVSSFKEYSTLIKKIHPRNNIEFVFKVFIYLKKYNFELCNIV